MRKLMSIGILSCLFAFSANAQDSLQLHLQGIKERVSQDRAIRNDFYILPALRPFQYKQSMTPVDISYFSDNKELYNYQLGSGDKGFRIKTDSYIKNSFPNLTLWGNATYENIKVQDLKFNETSDYHLVFPYLIADSVGGNLNAEVYQFSGGIAKEIGNWVLAGEAGYKANLSHRKRDPRPDNNSSDIYAQIGASYFLTPTYLISAHVGGRFYKQRNTLDFISEKGRPQVFYFNGLAAYNRLLSGSFNPPGQFIYNVNGINANLSIASKNDSGFMAEVGVSQNSGKRTLPLSSANANDWTDQVISGKLGYVNANDSWRYGAMAKMDLQTRKGSEGLFNNDGAVTGGYTKISEISSYRYYNFQYNLEAFIGKENWSIKPFATFTQIKEQYLNPFREQWADIVKVGVQGQYLYQMKDGLFGISLNLQKQKVLDKNSVFNITRGTALEDLLSQNYMFLTAEPFIVGGEARYDFVVNEQVKPFVKANALTSTEIKQKYYALTLGFVF